MRKSTKIILVIVASVIVFIGVGYFVLLGIGFAQWRSEYEPKIDDIKYVSSSHGEVFRIEYEYERGFDTIDYTAKIYLDSDGSWIASIKLDKWRIVEVGEEDIIDCPDPDFKEIYYSADMCLYSFFKELIVFCHNGQYGYIDMSRPSAFFPYYEEKREQIKPVAEFIVNEPSIDQGLRDKCTLFLEETRTETSSGE